MPPTNNLAAQLTAYSLTHTTDAAATLPANEMGTSLRAQLEARAHDLQTQPFTLGPN